MSDGATFYAGVGADAEIEKLYSLVGKITGFWAEVEDGLLLAFVVAVAGTLRVDDIRPYRAVFFTVRSYEGKKHMVDKAMKARCSANMEILSEWAKLLKDLNDFAALRNKIAHLSPQAKGTPDPNAQAIV